MCLEIVEVPVSYVKRFSVYFYPTNSPRPQNRRGWNYTHVVWCVIKAVRVNVSVISGPTPALRQSSTFFILALIIRSNGEGNFCFTLQKYWTFLWDVGESLAVSVTYHCWLWLHHVLPLHVGTGGAGLAAHFDSMTTYYSCVQGFSCLEEFLAPSRKCNKNRCHCLLK